MDHPGFTRRIPKRPIFPQRPQPQPRHRRRDQHPTGIRFLRLPARRRRLLQQRGKQPNRVEHGLDVQIQHLAKRPVRVRVKRLAPRGARIGEQDVHSVRVFPDAVEKRLDALDGGTVRGHGDGLASRREVGELVEEGDGLVAGRGFAGGDEDFGAACLKEAVLGDERKRHRRI